MTVTYSCIHYNLHFLSTIYPESMQSIKLSLADVEDSDEDSDKEDDKEKKPLDESEETHF